MEENMCDLCKYGSLDCGEKPCSNCIQFVDGYLEYTRYEPEDNNMIDVCNYKEV